MIQSRVVIGNFAGHNTLIGHLDLKGWPIFP